MSSQSSSPQRKRRRIPSNGDKNKDPGLNNAGIVVNPHEGEHCLSPGRHRVDDAIEGSEAAAGKTPSSRSQVKNVHVHDGGIVATVENIPESVDWPGIKKALEAKLSDLPSDVDGDAVTFATKVDKINRSCCVVFKPFEVDEEFFRHMRFEVEPHVESESTNSVPPGQASVLENDPVASSNNNDDSTVLYELYTDPLYGIDLQEALKRLPAHVLRKRESRAKVERLKRNDSSSGICWPLPECRLPTIPSKASRGRTARLS
ncbi:hypothetical protein FOL47_009073 [Perkinsus chesapeaki]|uniref:Uncharacterized protein n=1 Tax=Perkinsus chesapeaki TaxID=330153 RepID=A0A7J6MT91_PERCH|nr:hypothetical protein FOL47_009073 [Perkinsus chesapeaki]